MVIRFTPAAMASTRLNVPSPRASLVMDAPFVAFRAMSVVRPWVLPLIVTALPLTIAPFFGDETVILGGDLVLDEPDDRRRIRLAARPDDRDREVVHALGQGDRDDRDGSGDRHLVDGRRRLVLEGEVDPELVARLLDGVARRP